ncbi:biotin/lipoyl-containing protein [Mangrovicoccus ximenensis]|uniref:biotin/lipoyl-containing protein n=1 Tax=Mangrovicoccus ximenensis TaxID=1911570 RepID=UPI000D351764
MDALAARAPEAPGSGPSAGPAKETCVRQVCLTAAEAYPALEAQFLGAAREIHASFRVFDPSTRLRGPDARAVGETWADLVAHVLGRGVHVTLVLSDFDAIARPELHRMANAHARAFERLRDRLPEGAGRLTVRLAPHPARMGLLPRLALLPVIRKHLAEQADELNKMSAADREEALRDLPGVACHLEERGGKLRVKRLILPEVLPGTHHQKLAVFDRTRLYIGGLDLDDRRWDTLEHRRPAADTWHDVQVLMEGPVATEAQAHLDRFLDETAGRQAPGPARELLRTLSSARRVALPFLGPRTLVTELEDAHLDAISRAERMIYLADLAAGGPAGDTLAAPMPGLVTRVMAAAGAMVSKGDPLIILEAMKMEHTLAAARDGTVAEVLVAELDQVSDGMLLLTMEAADA